MQAVFDILNFGINFSSYDHLQFPGVVPRTFLGSMIVSVLCVPLKILIRFFSLPELYQQIACRSVIGFLSWISFVHFRNGVQEKFGSRASQLTGVLTAFQFHICFYMSRSLPNVFALMLSLNAFAFWLKVSLSTNSLASTLGKFVRGLTMLSVTVFARTGPANAQHRAADDNNGHLPLRRAHPTGALYSAPAHSTRGSAACVIWCICSHCAQLTDLCVFGKSAAPSCTIYLRYCVMFLLVDPVHRHSISWHRNRRGLSARHGGSGFRALAGVSFSLLSSRTLVNDTS
jgi:hypothetical protein